jgi:hypothetical protein
MPNGRIMVSGATNLPEKAELSISVSNEEVGFSATGHSVVLNGTFSAGPLGPESGMNPGNYVVSVMMSVPMMGQPESVQLATGKKGEHLTGPLVKTESLFGTGNYVEYSFPFAVGSKQAIEKLQEANRKAVTEVRSALSRLLKNGRAMERYRHSNELAAIDRCREMMKENWDQATLVQAQAEALRTKTTPEEFINLGAASIEMTMCVTCSDNALEHCDRADDWLQGKL